jgi:glycosyltransferase involved in cell wall biosynthesis
MGMRIIQVNNFHRVPGGSDFMVELTTQTLKSRGHEVILLRRDSRELRGLLGKARAFSAGLFSPSGWLAIKKLLRDFKPDLVHAHELYPMFTPWILRACRQAGVPVVMTCHDFRLLCPTAFLCRHGQICEKCLEHNELWCIRGRCRGDFWEDAAYALRHWLARRLGLFRDNVTLFITLSEFARQKFISHGFPAARLTTIPNPISLQSPPARASKGRFAFAGKISREKGIDTLLAAARLTRLPVCLAGDDATYPDLVRQIPENVQLLGFLDRKQMVSFYQEAFCLVLPSQCYEMFGLVLVEAMAAGIPVIASNLGGIAEIVTDGVTGLLFQPGNAEDLARKMLALWENPQLARRLGQAGREKALANYREELYYQRLMAAYAQARAQNQAGDTG